VIIECRGLTKRFRGREAVSGLNLQVPEGAALALVGSNGAGKSTLLRMLTNILRPDAGVATVAGVESTRLSPEHLMQVGYVSENPKLPERLTVSQYFDYLRALYPNWDRRHETSLRARLELPAHQRVGQLSHGMRMKLILIGALSFHPKLLILDEPLSGLDPVMRDEVLEGVLAQADETTIVISSHELTEIEGFATQIAFIAQGRLLFHQDMEELNSRFRNVIVTLREDVRRSLQLPPEWLIAESSGAVWRFVETTFSSDEDMARKVSAHFGDVLHFESRAMSLREISKALMRTHRTERLA
jgi:ABC-2 type transport system ATP-binding protein